MHFLTAILKNKSDNLKKPSVAGRLLSIPLRTSRLFVFAAHCCEAPSAVRCLKMLAGSGGDHAWTRVRPQSGAEAERVDSQRANVTDNMLRASDASELIWCSKGKYYINSKRGTN